LSDHDRRPARHAGHRAEQFVGCNADRLLQLVCWEVVPLAELEKLGDAATAAAEQRINDALAAVAEQHADTPAARLVATLTDALTTATADAATAQTAAADAEARLKADLTRGDLSAANDAERDVKAVYEERRRLDNRVAVVSAGLADARQTSAASLRAALEAAVAKLAADAESERAALSESLLTVARERRAEVERVGRLHAMLHSSDPLVRSHRERLVAKHAEAAA
jgi:hypothetical protein